MSPIGFFRYFVLFSAVATQAASTVLVNHTNFWHYHKGTNAPQPDWTFIAAEDLGPGWPTGRGGIGYGDGDDATVLNDMRNLYTAVFIRQEFTVTSPFPSNAVLSLVVDYDDGFVAYLDGAEVARDNAPGAPGSPIAHTDVAGTGHEAGTQVTFSLGPVGNRLWNGTHILALIGLNDDRNSSDLSLIADLVVGDPPGDVIWRAADSPIVVGSTYNVPAGGTLTIEPGVTVLFNQGASLTVAGQLFALGTPSQRIAFTRNTGATSWGGIAFSANTVTSYIAHADLNYSTANIDANGTTLYLQDLTWSNTTAQLVDLVNCSISLLDSFIPGGFGNEPIHFSSFPANGHALIKDNVFGAPAGYNDSIDFTGGNRPGPIAQFIGNVFLVAVDDCLDLDGTDAHIEGNIFMNVHQDAARASTANAISTGADGGATSELVIVRNLFYNVEHALLVKNAGSAVFDNNTVVNISSNQFAVVLPACVSFGEPHRGDPDGRGVLMDGNIFWDVRAEAPFLHLKDTMLFVMNRSIMPGTNIAGIGNSTNDPMLVNWQGPITAANIRSNFALLPGSPAIGAGPNGLDMGALVPSGASISGPAGTTSQTNATLRVAGPGVVAFRWKLNNGPWSAEIPLTNSFQISTNYFNPTNGLVTLNGLTNGAYTFYAIGKNSAGYYQPTNTAASRTWTVDNTLLRVDRITKSGSTVKLYFQAVSTETYIVEYRNALATGAWDTLTQISDASGEVEVTDDTANVPERAYRIVK